MLKLFIGILIAFLIGAACRYFNLPVPAPPTIYGVLLIFAITLGYIVADNVLPKNTEAQAQAVEVNK
jgi:XapX domain-containing protein